MTLGQISRRTVMTVASPKSLVMTRLVTENYLKSKLNFQFIIIIMIKIIIMIIITINNNK